MSLAHAHVMKNFISGIKACKIKKKKFLFKEYRGRNNLKLKSQICNRNNYIFITEKKYLLINFCKKI